MDHRTLSEAVGRIETQQHNKLTEAVHGGLSRVAAGGEPAPGDVLAPPVPLVAFAVEQTSAAVRHPLGVLLFSAVSSRSEGCPSKFPQ